MLMLISLLKLRSGKCILFIVFEEKLKLLNNFLNYPHSDQLMGFLNLLVSAGKERGQ